MNIFYEADLSKLNYADDYSYKDVDTEKMARGFALVLSMLCFFVLMFRTVKNLKA